MRVSYVSYDTELYLVDTYTAATMSGQAYRIVVSVTDTIPEIVVPHRAAGVLERARPKPAVDDVRHR